MSAALHGASPAPRDGSIRSRIASAFGLAVLLGLWPWFAARIDATNDALDARERELAEFAALQTGRADDPTAVAARVVALADLFGGERLVWCPLDHDGYVAIAEREAGDGALVAGVALR